MNKNNTKIKLSKIAGSLSYGIFLTGSRKEICYILVGNSIFLAFFGTISIMLEHMKNLDLTTIFSLIGFYIVLLLFFAMGLSTLKKNKKLEKKIILWLEDAVSVKAYSKNVGYVRAGFQPKQIKIQVNFEINGKEYIRFSEGIGFHRFWDNESQRGYHKIWAYYADREIDILYSEKYDQVLVLKDDAKQLNSNSTEP